MATPLPVIPNTYRVAFNWLAGVAMTATNVMHFRAAAGFPDPAAISEVLDDCVTANMWNSVAGSAQVQEIVVTPLDGTSGSVTFAKNTLPAYGGGAGGDPVPAVAAIAKLTTGVRGRSNRGRVYIPFISEGQMVNGQITGGGDVFMSTAWNTFNVALGADADTPTDFVVASYDRAHHGAGAHATTIIDVVVELALATQRRRQTRLRS